jgi:hypothetical protein
VVSDPGRSEVYPVKILGLESHSLLEHSRCPQAHYNGRTQEVGTVMMLGQSSELPSRAESTCADPACDPVSQRPASNFKRPSRIPTSPHRKEGKPCTCVQLLMKSAGYVTQRNGAVLTTTNPRQASITKSIWSR